MKNNQFEVAKYNKMRDRHKVIRLKKSNIFGMR